jgi:hypothetical protein
MVVPSRRIHIGEIEDSNNELQRSNNKKLLDDAKYRNVDDRRITYIRLGEMVNTVYTILIIDIAIMFIMTFFIIFDSNLIMYIFYTLLVMIHWVFVHTLKVETQFSRGTYEVSKSSVYKCKIVIYFKLAVTLALLIYASVVAISCSAHTSSYTIRVCSSLFIVSTMIIGILCNLIFTGLSYFYILKVDKIRIESNKYIRSDDNNLMNNLNEGISNDNYDSITYNINGGIQSNVDNTKLEINDRNNDEIVESELKKMGIESFDELVSMYDKAIHKAKEEDKKFYTTMAKKTKNSYNNIYKGRIKKQELKI